jgi:hypothetical protein
MMIIQYSVRDDDCQAPITSCYTMRVYELLVRAAVYKLMTDVELYVLCEVVRACSHVNLPCKHCYF